MTVLYDDYPYKKGLITKRGFSCMIKGTEKTILFDTGGDGDVLLHNLRMLKVSPEEIDAVVISHDHGDHTGGLLSLVNVNSKVTVFVPPGISDALTQQLFNYKVRLVTVSTPMPICKGVYSSGVMGKAILEQSLILKTRAGLILITGCSHPGITNIIESAIMMFNKPVLFVFGGFHLESAPENRIRMIIKKFITYGVRKVGGSHCTGFRAMRLFKEAYGRNYIQMGVGKTVVLR
jgi:7,8-dihydropterin-6-yl-methyl-4-(beta-D-ribofuranosyl)aminobenzene 5'-phosphate synthase